MVQRRTSTYQLVLAFFGLTSDITSQYRLSVFNQIHEIVFHGRGGYTWDIVYNMPLWLRKYTFDALKEWYTPKENQENENSWVEGAATQEAAKNKKIKPPTYVTKALRKK